jgi:hypothetical protein
VGGAVQQIQLRIEGRENGVPLNLQMSEPRMLIRLRMYFPRNGIRLGFVKTSEFQRAGGRGVELVRHCTPMLWFQETQIHRTIKKLEFRKSYLLSDNVEKACNII